MKNRTHAALVLGLTFGLAGPATSTQDPFELDVEAIDRVFAEWDRPDSPGCSIAVVKDGKIVYSRGYGMANLEHGVPNGSKTVFRIGSTSKQITAAVIALLAEDGVLSLDDDLRKWVPEIPDYGETITIRHLIHHCSGLRDYLELMSYAGRRDEDYYTGEEALAMLGRQKATNFEPGSRFTYSNSGYFLLSVVCARASGKSLREFAQERIFGPLGMERTHFHDDHREIVPERASGYARNDQGDWEISMTTLEMCGDGGVFTTVEDFARWDQNFYTGAVGGDEFLKTIQTPGGTDSGEPHGYAFGLDIGQRRGLPTVSHGGAFVGFQAEMLRFPEQAFSVLCFANSAGFSPTRRCMEVADICLADVYPEEPLESGQRRGRRRGSRPRPEFVELDVAALEAHAGTYASEELGVDYTARVAGDHLLFSLGGAEEVAFRPLKNGAFRGAFGLELVFERDEDERVTGFVLNGGRVRGIVFRRR